ncbi:nucleolar protein 14 [Pseudomassariella vexata]|uniref:Nucleolar protein 14 n=1 Tax=Pseudomassariella vexata TaxID=1141098 RepID=A0A1Y2DM10_9PEZI|nr:nucleolar protein 14 [Pseudomassariella vexata]ORY60179.1 nucleolar protein 14 [Pseudomassariella vexata]
MAGSQLKRLKASLHEQGLIGPQKSKKQRKSQPERAKNNKRLEKLEEIREQFNPFDLKHNVRGPKFQVTSNRPDMGNASKKIQGRPTDARGAGEEQRRQTLLVEMQRRQKVGGIRDRRFGENDPTMAPEDKMLERFAREKMANHKRSGMFDLEDDESNVGFGLTHMGKSLSLDGPSLVDDYDEMDEGSAGDSDDEGHKAYLKRKALTEVAFPDDDADAEDGQPERKKSKQEVMKEVIAKSKFYKYERQAAKDADEDLREELDKELPDLHMLLLNRGMEKKPTSLEDQEAATTAEREQLDRAYDLRVRQLAQDKRAQPTERMKTAEEQAEEASARLKELEEKRIRRMQGQAESDSESEDDDAEAEDEPVNGPIKFTENDEDDGFGLGKIKIRPTAQELGFDDEDDFMVEDDLVASGSDVSAVEDEDDGSSDEDDDSDDVDGVVEDDDNEFTKGLTLDSSAQATNIADDPEGLPSMFPCPETQEELLGILECNKITLEKLPTMVQKIRAVYHPRLDSAHATKIAQFSRVLIQHLPYLCSFPTLPPFSVIESLIRHIHSLAKTYPIQVAEEFICQLEDFGKTRPLAPTLGDIIVLTAVGTIFPTSDHFHQVATPATLLSARYLGQKVPFSIQEYAKGAYLAILILQYQRVSKRYVPEITNFCLYTLYSLAPKQLKTGLGWFPLHSPPTEMRIRRARSVEVRKLSCLDCVKSAFTEKEALSARVAVFHSMMEILDVAADTWTGKTSFLETFQPFSNILAHLAIPSCRSELPEALNTHIIKSKAKMDRMLNLAQLARRPLELHHHKPLAIRANYPKFEDSYDPNKHYDPDRERAEAAKLRAEHRKERKGAMRELRKDAAFVSREKLRVKKAKDAAYEKKYKRLVAEIQGEEGRESNAYEREKAQRKRASKR